MFSTAELLRDPCPVCSTRLSPYESKEYGKCIVCFLDAKQAGVKANLERAKSMTAPAVPRATKRVPITVVDPSETLRPVKEYLLDVTVPWEAARDRIILAIIGVNPHIPKVIAARLEQAQFRLNGTNIKKTSEIYRAFVSNTVPIILDLNGSEPEVCGNALWCAYSTNSVLPSVCR